MICFVGWTKCPCGSLCWCLELRKLVRTLTVVRPVVNWADWDGERYPGLPSQGALITGKGLHIPCHARTGDRQDQCAPNHSEKTSGLPRGAALRTMQTSSFFFQFNGSISKNATAWGENRGEASGQQSQLPNMQQAGRKLAPTHFLPHRGAMAIILGHHLSFPVPHQADESQLDPISRGLIW